MNAHMNTILAAILVVIVVSILMNNSMRSYLFNTIMGRSLLLFLIICITILNAGLGLIMTIIVIGLHTSQEGFENSSIQIGSAPTIPFSSTESFANVGNNNNSNSNRKYNKIDKISAENRVRPRQSKGLPVPHVHKKREPESNSPNNESFLSYSTF